MGIRFQCQNGHKLHVKSFLAGKHGICPECGVKLLIPNDLKRGKPTVLDSAIQIAKTGPKELVRNAEPVESGRNAEPVSPQHLEVQNRSPAPPPLPPAALSTETSSDPIDAAPHAVWYVRPPTGEQYGPASGEVLRGWIAEGRVTSNCHVWREGWDDWRSADVLLQPEQVRTAEPPTIVEPAVASSPPAADMLQIDIVGRPNARLKQRKRALLLVCMLVIVCLVLLVLLIYLVTVGP